MQLQLYSFHFLYSACLHQLAPKLCHKKKKKKKWHMTPNTWHVIGDMWHVSHGGGGEHSIKMLAPQLLTNLPSLPSGFYTFPEHYTVPCTVHYTIHCTVHYTVQYCLQHTLNCIVHCTASLTLQRWPTLSGKLHSLPHLQCTLLQAVLYTLMYTLIHNIL